MERRVFVIQAGRAFPVVAGALYLIGCGSSTTSPSATTDISSTSTVVNGHTHHAMVRHFDGITIINAGTLRRDAEAPGFLIVDFAARTVEMLRFTTPRDVVSVRIEHLL